MVTPYDWQESLQHRMRYVESRLEAGIPVVAMSIPAGILMATYRYETNKVFEIYDRIAFSAIGMQSDLENLRVEAIEYCHREGYRRSTEDVTLQRLIVHLSGPIKQAFGDMRSAPLVIRGIFAEVNEDPEHDRLITIDFDGDFDVERSRILLAGKQPSLDAMSKELEDFNLIEASLDDAAAKIKKVVRAGMDDEMISQTSGDNPELTFESALLRRDQEWTRKFVRLEGKIL